MAELAHNDIATSDIVVKIHGVSKTFKQRQRSETASGIWKNLIRPEFKIIRALSDINLTISRGEIVAYAGANGAGKSTTVKLCSGMLSPDSGSVDVLGMNPVKDRTRYVSRIGVVFGQRTELWFDHPVSASFEWKREVWNIPRNDYNRMLEFVKGLLNLDEFFSSQARELSLGQRMRADLGLALIHEPELLFLDEPTLGLDVLAKRNVLRFIKDLNRERNVTIMVTSHDMSDLEQLAGRIVMIDKGRLAFDGDFGKLRREFADKRVLLIETEAEVAPILENALHTGTEASRHTYMFDAAQITVSELLVQASASTRILDVETQRADIDDVIADIYQRWQTSAESEVLPTASDRSGK